MLKSIANLSLSRLVRNNNSRFQKKFLNWDDIQSIALIIEESENIAKQQVDDLIDQLNKHCEVYYLELKSKIPTYSDWKCLTKKDINLLGLPKKTSIQPIINKRYDLVINTASQSILYSAALSNTFQSTCSCSSSEKHEHSNLIIQRSNNQNLLQYLKEVERYLKMINSKNTQPV